MTPPSWQPEIAACLKRSRARWDTPMREATSFRIGGPADCLIDLESEEELLGVFRVIRTFDLAWRILGKGSNILVADEGLRGVTLRLGKGFSGVTRKEGPGGLVRAGAGVSNPVFVRTTRGWGLGGMEYLMAIPGSLGGAMAMNAGAHGKETVQFLREARVFRVQEGEIRDIPTAGLDFGYRRSALSAANGNLALEGVFALESLDAAEMARREKEIQQIRRETQPRENPNCGSVFKNPPGHFAARLIQEAGLKGTRLGEAQISLKHANFIVNLGQATAADVLGLITIIQKTVKDSSGVELETEVQVIR